MSVNVEINFHDGLLETHDLSASINKKLKCLTLEDQFGRDIRFTGGILTSRILAINTNAY